MLEIAAIFQSKKRIFTLSITAQLKLEVLKRLDEGASISQLLKELNLDCDRKTVYLKSINRRCQKNCTTIIYLATFTMAFG